MTQNYRVHDLMAEFAADNPYPDDVGNRLMVVARKYRNAHPEEFIYIKDWKENIHSVWLCNHQWNHQLQFSSSQQQLLRSETR